MVLGRWRDISPLPVRDIVDVSYSKPIAWSYYVVESRSSYSPGEKVGGHGRAEGRDG